MEDFIYGGGWEVSYSIAPVYGGILSYTVCVQIGS
jgi:hypothetical protein